MTPVYPDRKIYLDDDRDGIAETDITARIASDIDLQDGFRDARSTNRIPPSGTIRFELENSDGYYEHAAQLLGKSVSFRLVYAGVEQQIFWGYITGAEIDSGLIDPRRVPVTVHDWLHTANNTSVKNLEVLTNQRADQAIPYVVGITAVPPAYTLQVPEDDPDYNVEIPGTDLDTGTEVFPNIFDSAKGRKTKVYSELDKIVKGELGRLYLLHNRGRQGQVLRLENKYARGSTRPLARTPIHYGAPARLKYHGPGGTSGLLKYHGPSGTSGALLIHEAQDASFANHFDAGWNSGRSVITDYGVTIIPRATVPATVVYTLGSPIEFGANERKRLNFTYSNPQGGSIIQASDVEVTDYAFNAERDGSGADLTANFVFLYNDFANYLQMAAENNGPAGFLITLELTGTGIYKYNPIEQTATNEESQVYMRTEISESLTREYSSDLNSSIQFANGEVGLHRHPTRDINWVDYHASYDEAHLLAFLFLGVGDKIQVTQNFPEHVGEYYIQGRKAKISLGGIVDFRWYLEEETKTMCVPIAVRSTQVDAGQEQAIDFGILPYLANLTQFTYSMWVNRLDSGTFAVLLSHAVDTGSGRRGNFVILNTNGDVQFFSYKTPDDGDWEAAGLISSENTWVHLCITYDNSSDQADPEIWFDGVKQTVIENGTPSGTSDDDSDCPLILFNTSRNPLSSASYFYDVIHDVAMKDPRIYGRILHPTEIVELANNEDVLDNVQDGLLFHGIYAPKDNRADYEGHTIENDDWVLDIVHRAAGIPFNDDNVTTANMFTGEAI